MGEAAETLSWSLQHRICQARVVLWRVLQCDVMHSSGGGVEGILGGSWQMLNGT